LSGAERIALGFLPVAESATSLKAWTDQRLLDHIRRVHGQSRESYGTRKVHKALNAAGIDCGRDRIGRLRRQAGIVAKRRQRFIVTTRSKHRHWIAPNLVARNFTAAALNQVWVGGVTFIPTQVGWLYLAMLMDLYPRKVVGWSMSNRNNDQALVNDALEMAVQRQQPAPGLIHHSDRGSVYASQSYRDRVIHYGMTSSMSRKKDCWDNAVAESFFSTLKNELTWGVVYANREQAKSAIFDYIEVFYNRQRLHQSLDYRTPLEVEQTATHVA
jgi:transposase InsO family protein